MNQVLQRSVGLPGAVLLGLGSILGTGVFVSLGLGASHAGDALLAALAVGAILAACNGLSSARLAARMPVSGGTYEYATRLIHPAAGFAAGWCFLCAKSASAATAALGVAGYLLQAFGMESAGGRAAVALVLVLTITLAAAGGLRRSNAINAVAVSLTLLGLGTLVVTGVLRLSAGEVVAPTLGAPPTMHGFLYASALMFVAYTGYGRVATLGEEIRDPARSIPRAVVLTVLTSLLVYGSVAFVALAALGSSGLGALSATTAAPLDAVASALRAEELRFVLAVSAVAAMVGVLLNLVIGLSRVALAMARRGDLPQPLARVDEGGTSPRRAVLAVGAVIAVMAATGDIRFTWSLSAFTVLLYYGITNASVLRMGLSAAGRVVATIGLVGCAGLAVSVDADTWLAGAGVLLVGFFLRAILRRFVGPLA